MDAAAQPIQRALVTKWHAAYYAEGCGPSVQWVKNMIQDGTFAGEKIGGVWYIFVYAGTLEPVKPKDAPPRSDAEALATTGDAIADGLMEQWLKVG